MLPVNQTVAQGPRALTEGRQVSKKLDFKGKKGDSKKHKAGTHPTKGAEALRVGPEGCEQGRAKVLSGQEREGRPQYGDGWHRGQAGYAVPCHAGSPGFHLQTS